MYLLTAVGITVGFHRLLTHRSFQTSKPLEYTFAVLGSMAVQGPVISWVADHRKHHAHTDEEGDPHSPHVGHDGGVRGVLAGLWHAHTGWLMSTQGRADWKRYAPDLYEDRGMRTISRQLRPARARSAWRSRRSPATSSAAPSPAPLTGLLWGGLVRIFFVHHVTWSVNSVCHFFGTGGSTPTIARPTSSGWRCPRWASPGTTTTTPSPAPPCTACKRWELDPSALIIAAMEKLAWPGTWCASHPSARPNALA